MTTSDGPAAAPPEPGPSWVLAELERALLALALGDFTARVPRDLTGDTADVVACLVNHLAEELVALSSQAVAREQQLVGASAGPLSSIALELANVRRVLEPLADAAQIGAGPEVVTLIGDTIEPALTTCEVCASELARVLVGPEEPGDPTTTPTRRPGLPDGARVLVVVDDPALHAALGQVAVGADVVAVHGGAALDLLRRGEDFQLVLCDADLRETTGAAVFDAARRADPGVADRFVWMTLDGERPPTPFDAARAVRKPLDPARLSVLLATLCGRPPPREVH